MFGLMLLWFGVSDCVLLFLLSSMLVGVDDVVYDV